MILSDAVIEAVQMNLWFVADALGDPEDGPWINLAKWFEEEDFEIFEYESVEQAENIGHSIGILHGIVAALGVSSEEVLKLAGLLDERKESR